MIDTQEKLLAFLPVMKSAAWLAIDTEADRLHAYPEKVCLIQISTTDGDRLIDPLAPMDINPFLAALTGRELIFHAADYDLRLLKKHHDFTPTEIFAKPDCGYWNNQTPSGQNKLGPSSDRWKVRSATYPGIALAMADQWGACPPSAN